MKYRFTYEITTNCNYKCEYCVAYRDEKFSENSIISSIIYFFNQLNNLNDTEIIEIQLFGGECTLHPDFLYIVKELSKLDKVKFILFTNLSADLNIYKQFCQLAKNKIINISASYHYNHCNTEEFIYKMKSLLDYCNVKANCMLAKGRYNENDYINIFHDLIKFNNFAISMFPILQSNHLDNVEPNYNNIVENKDTNVKLHIDKNTINQRYGCLCDSYITNAFMSSTGILSRCFQDKNTINLNICSSDNPIAVYKRLCQLRIKCYYKTCYEFADWVKINE